MTSNINLSAVSDEQIKDEFFRRMRCWQYPERNVVLLGKFILKTFFLTKKKVLNKIIKAPKQINYPTSSVVA